jgi:hypothetical protein
MTATAPLSIRIPDELHDAMLARAGECSMTPSEYAAEALARALDDIEAPPPSPPSPKPRTLTVPADVAADVTARAAELGTSVSEVVRQSLIAMLHERIEARPGSVKVTP